jgi:hypothetical protein
MGVVIYYGWKAECSEQELVARLQGLRDRIQALGVRSVSDVIRVDPVCDPWVIDRFERQGLPIPPAVTEALERKTPTGRAHGEWCLILGTIFFDTYFDKPLMKRWYQPMFEFLDSDHGLWDESEVPESVTSGSITTFSAGIESAFADALLRYGFLIHVELDPGCESFTIGLSGYRGVAQPLWLGACMTKTQYSERLVHSHETVCRILDFAKEDGLLAGASDTCGFYEHRDWRKSAGTVNLETTFARVMSDVLADVAEKSGGAIKVISDPALKSYNLIVVKPETSEEDSKEG